MEMTTRNKIFIILLIAACIAGYSLFTKYQPSKNHPRYTAYMGAKEKAIGPSDQEEVEKFRAKICRNLVQMIQDSGSAHGLHNTLESHRPKGFQPRACTFAYLQIVCLIASRAEEEIAPRIDQLTKDVNLYVGNGSFPDDLLHNRLNAGMKDEIDHLMQDRYLMVLKPKAVVKPEYYVGTSRFTTGSFDGDLFVVDLQKDSILGKLDFHAENSDNFRSSPLTKSGMDKKLVKDLMNKILERVSDYSHSLFGLRLEDPDKKIYGLLDEPQ